jgi:adenylate kinase family enzyme
VRRVVVRGSSGSGKTTTGRRLAAILGVSFIELDALHHGPNWAEPPDEEFRRRVETALAAAPGGWVVDGAYTSKLGDLVVARADTFIWLDLPLRTSLRRLWRRTWRRIIRREELWGGNRERIWTAFLMRDSLFHYTIKRHRPGRQTIMQQIERHPHLRVVHLRSPAEVESFLKTVERADGERASRQP